MKKFKWFMLVLIASVFLAACAPSVILTSSAVQVPIEVKVALNAVILLGVMFGLQFVFDKLHIDLRGIGVTIATALTETVILQLQGWIDLVPVQYDPIVTLGLQIVLAVLVFLGSIRLITERERAKQLLGPR